MNSITFIDIQQGKLTSVFPQGLLLSPDRSSFNSFEVSFLSILMSTAINDSNEDSSRQLSPVNDMQFLDRVVNLTDAVR